MYKRKRPIREMCVDGSRIRWSQSGDQGPVHNSQFCRFELNSTEFRRLNWLPQSNGLVALSHRNETPVDLKNAMYERGLRHLLSYQNRMLVYYRLLPANQQSIRLLTRKDFFLFMVYLSSFQQCDTKTLNLQIPLGLYNIEIKVIATKTTKIQP